MSMKIIFVSFVMLSSILISCSVETVNESTTTTSTTLSAQESEILEWSEATYDVVEKLTGANGRLIASFMSPRYNDDYWVLEVAADLLTLGGLTMPSNIYVPDEASIANNTLKEAVDLGYLIFQEMPDAIDQGNSSRIKKNVSRLENMTELLNKFGLEVSAISSSLE